MVKTAKIPEAKKKVINEHGVAVIEVSTKPWQDKIKPVYGELAKILKIPEGYIQKVMDIK